MRCSARSFGVGEQLLGEAPSSSGVSPRGRVPAIGCGDRPAAGHLDERLGDEPTTASTSRRGAGAQQVHVGARVRRPQHAVDVERVGRCGRGEALGDHDLEGLAGPDRPPCRLDDLLVPLLRCSAAPRRGGVDRLGVDDATVLGAGAARSAVIGSSRRHGVGPGLVDALVGVVVVDRVGDEQDRAVGVVEDREVGGEQHAPARAARSSGAGRAAAPSGARRRSEVADHAAGQRRQARGAARWQAPPWSRAAPQRVAGRRHARRAASPIQCASPSSSVSVAALRTPTIE